MKIRKYRQLNNAGGTSGPGDCFLKRRNAELADAAIKKAEKKLQSKQTRIAELSRLMQVAHIVYKIDVTSVLRHRVKK